ncbi:putative nuclease of restriction endonuclease-like (RecB) superfamily [Spirosoma oryzae]|uniref:Putative nuclease of restriction endonuclease-like (RecB) superfamily n=1 Tax=Spirosoma oryzae TaxID=1469603 RepID=A0A2T0RNN6_9BACT|nr:PDDEXK nuclease domain-containing protein [Spirosoma oryzae]PRY22723.1 putative nuclease of restriction endonuclease-like (RecB) superfamily [Spirosoma oryzae]
MQFSDLITTLGGLHQRLSQQAARQTDQLLTLRNYLFGFYIVEFEQHGTDRATYGEQLLKRLATELRSHAIKGVSDRSLRQYRQFYLAYPQIWQTASAKFNLPDFEQTRSIQTTGGKPGEQDIPQLNPALLLDRLTYSHFVELVKVDNPLLRRFYEVEALKNNWKVHELNRAITTLLAERTSLSTDKAAVIARIQQNQPATFEDLIRSPYLLEFLGLEEKPAYTENDLETAIIDHLQDFLLELGRGFCFEARQKRISFGNRHYRIDLVFYHRILKCHVLVDLKIGEFDHADAGQMIVYLNYYKANEMSAGDNPPVGLILCASKDNALVEYATSGMSHELFVSQYLAELPDKEQLKALIERESQGF